MKRLSVLAMIFALMSLAGCATIMKGTDQPISFSSDPDSAKITIYDDAGIVVSSGKTPYNIHLSRGNGYFTPGKYRVVFEADGYEKKEVWVRGELDAGWYLIGNFITGYILGWLVIDPISGAMWNLRPVSASAQLEKSLSGGNAVSLKVILANQVPSDLMSQAVLIREGK